MVSGTLEHLQLCSPQICLLPRGDTAACEGKLWWKWRRSIRKQKPPVRLWRPWTVLDKQE